VSETGKKLILLTMAVLLSLGAVEVLLRVIGYGTITPEMNFGVNTQMALDKGRFLPDRDLFWKLPVHPLDKQWHAVNPDVRVPPKGDRRRILVMGDSCSRLSTAIPPYSVLLEDSLGSLDVEVFNAAVPGYTTWQGRAWWARQLRALQSDQVVVYYGWNDHWRATGLTDRDYARRLQGKSLRLGLLFRKKPNPPPMRVPAEAYRDNLLTLVNDLERGGASVTLVTAPSHLTQEARARILQTRYLVRGDDAQAIHDQYQAITREVAAITDADLLDAAAVFAAMGEPKSLLMRDGIHLTDKGHRLMATLLAGQLGPELSARGPAPDIAALAARGRAFMQTDGER